MVQIIKKNGTTEDFNGDKIKRAIRKSAERVCVTLTDKEENKIVNIVKKQIQYNETPIPVNIIHNMVECALDTINPAVAKSYREYRDNKSAFASMLDKVYNKKLSLNFIGDRSNANADSALTTTQKAIVYNELNSELYKKFFLTREEEKAMSDGYIYIHDRGSRLDTMNCFAEETRFITSKGVKSFKDFNDGDIIYVPSHKGNWQKAIVKSYGEQSLNKITIKRGSQGDKVVYATPNHRWILKDGSETTNLKVGDKLVRTPDISRIEWEELSHCEKVAWCIGFCMADGNTTRDSINSYSSTIRLCGDKVNFAHYFEDAGFNVTKPKSIHGDMRVRIPHFKKNEFDWTKYSLGEIKSFANGYLCADGNKNLIYKSNSTWRGVQVTGNNNDFIYDILNISGYYITNVVDKTNEFTNYGKRTQKTKHYGFYSDCGDRTWVVKDISSTDRIETVWCLEVENDHSFLLECGIPAGNCCLFDMKNVLDGGFEMGNLHYNEPKTLDVAFDLIADVAMNAASCQYGGFSISEVDKLLGKYAKMSYEKYYNECLNLLYETTMEDEDKNNKADKYAMSRVQRDFEQGFQGWEMKFNSVASSRGDYPFTSISFGLGTDKFETMASSACLKVRKNGQGKKGFEHPVLFPKLSFFYDENLHGKGKELEWLFDEAIDCSSKAMYPDYISCTGDGYGPSMYKKYGVTISRMGCRANLSPWYERGGMSPADENDKPIYEGRFNLGAISLHFPMIVAKAQQENKDFYEVLTYYLELCRHIHQRTFKYLSHKKAGTNPLGFCQGGFLNGNFDPEQEIGEDFLRPMTMSFGITALNEASVLYCGKTIVEDNTFAIEVLKFINDYADKCKKEDNILYAIYGTPAESLCGLQIEQFRKKYGIITGVSDRPYTTNSFHCGVWEDISPIQKQDIEYPMFHLCNGGNIQYCRYPIDYNKDAIKTLVRRAMDMGFYEGVNLQLDYCEKCGHQFIDSDVCPKCGSEDITRIERMNGLT